MLTINNVTLFASIHETFSLLEVTSVQVTFTGESSQNMDSDDDEPTPFETKRPRQYQRTGRDLTEKAKERFKWNEVVSFTDMDYTPVKLFELFFDDVVCQYIVTETELYAKQKGNHMFTISIVELKVFL